MKSIAAVLKVDNGVGVRETWMYLPAGGANQATKERGTPLITLTDGG